MNNYLLFLNVTKCCVDVLPPFTEGCKIFPLLIFDTLCLGNSLFICRFNCGMFLNPKNCFTTITNTQKHHLSNFPLNSQSKLGTLNIHKR